MKQEKKNSRVRLILVMIVLLAALLAAIFLTDPGGEKNESIQEVMKDAVLHEDNQMAFLGMRVNPSVISDWVVTGLLLVVAAMGISMTGVMLREKPTFPDAAASVYPLFTCFLPMSMFMMMMNMEQLQKYQRDIQKFTNLRNRIIILQHGKNNFLSIFLYTFFSSHFNAFQFSFFFQLF